MDIEQIFIPRASAYAAALARWKAGVAIWWLIPPLLASTIAGCFDIRWWFVGLMLLFIVYPMLLTLVWFSLLSKPQISMLLRPQQWAFDNDGTTTITFFSFTPSDEDRVICDNFSFTTSDVVQFNDNGKSASFRLKKGLRFEFLIFPHPLPKHILTIYES